MASPPPAQFFVDPKGTVGVIDPETGVAQRLPKAEAVELLQQGWAPQGKEQFLQSINAEERQAERAAEYDNPLAAGFAGLMRGATMGLSDAAWVALGGEQSRRELAGLKEFNPTASTVGDVAGSVAGMFIPGGPVAATTRLGAGVAKGIGEGGGALARIAATTARGVTEGAAFGLGGGVSELALQQKPITAEDAASILARHMGAGAAFGGGLGLVGGGVSAAVRGATGKLGLGRATKAQEGLAVANEELDQLVAGRQSDLARVTETLGTPMPAAQRKAMADTLKRAEADMAREPADAIILKQAKEIEARAAASADARAEYLAAKSAYDTAVSVEANAVKLTQNADEILKKVAQRDSFLRSKGLESFPSVDERIEAVISRSSSAVDRGENIFAKVNRLAEEHGVATFKKSRERELGQVLLDIEHKLNPTMSPKSWAHYATTAGEVGKLEGDISRLGLRGSTDTFGDVIARTVTARATAREGIDAALAQMQKADAAVQATRVSQAAIDRAKREVALIESRSAAGQTAKETRAALAADDELAAQVSFLKRAPGDKVKGLDVLPPDLQASYAKEQELLALVAEHGAELGGKKSGLAGKLLGRMSGMGAARAVRRATGSSANSFGTGGGSLLGGASAATAAALVSGRIAGFINGGLALGGVGLKAVGAVLEGAVNVADKVRPAVLKFGSEEMFNLKRTLDSHRTPEGFEAHLRASLADQPAADAEKLIRQEVRKYAFLASKMPRSPQQQAMDRGELPIPTQKKWKASPTAVAQYARYVSGIVDPLAVPRLFKAGRLTPEAVEAARAVFPEALAGFQTAVEARVRADYAAGKIYSAAVERNVRTLMQPARVAATAGDMIFQMSFKIGKARVQPSRGFGKAVSLSKALMPQTDSINQR